jgi:hypothetical protein
MRPADAEPVLTELPSSAHALKFCDTLEIDHAAHCLYAGDNWARPLLEGEG